MEILELLLDNFLIQVLFVLSNLLYREFPKFLHILIKQWKLKIKIIFS